MKALFAILLFPSFVSAAVLDAAELDIAGNPLIYQGAPMAAWRATVDNTEGMTDLVGVRFAMNWTGTANAMPSVWWDNPLNPWYGAFNAQWEFLVDGVLWYGGIHYSGTTHEWGPAFAPAGAMPDPNHWWLIPAGCSWDAVMAISGPDVKLFQSPASGDLTIDGVATTLYDDNPLPQTIPEPSSTLLLSLLAYGLLGRRRHAANTRC